MELIYGAVDALLAGSSRGAGVLLLAHSAGCELAVRMAAAERGTELLGLELADTGHNVSLGRTSPAYHLGVLAFAEECIIARRTGEFSGPDPQFDGGAAARPGR